MLEVLADSILIYFMSCVGRPVIGCNMHGPKMLLQQSLSQ